MLGSDKLYEIKPRFCTPIRWRCKKCGLVVDRDQWLALQIGKAFGIQYFHEWEPIEYKCEEVNI